LRAAVYEGTRELYVRDVPEPTLGPHDVLVKPKYVGICGSDLNAWQYGMFESGVIIGHEFCGDVVEIGKDVAKWSSGDRVVPNSLIPCGECSFCNQKRYSLCQDMQMVGISMNGGMADLVSIPEDTLYRLPKSVDYKMGAMIEPLAVVTRAFDRAQFTKGMNVLILGAGPIGLLSLLVAKDRRAGRVIVSEVKPARLSLAESLGADDTVNPLEQSLSLRLESLTNAQGADLVIECTGAPGPSSETFRLVRRGGTILVLGICEEPVETDFMTGVLNELSVQFSYLGYAEFPKAIQLISSGRVNPAPLVTKVIPLERVAEDGFELLTSPGSSDVKVLVQI
jgi:2-desacetyl-2-hydroxyethyl bacteriochlorophyllide A dehydrogenase